MTEEQVNNLPVLIPPELEQKPTLQHQMAGYTAKVIDFYDRFNALVTMQTEFSIANFGPDCERGPRGPLDHLRKEAIEAFNHPEDIEEYADCLILLLDATRRGGFTINAVINAATVKMQKNKERKWPEYPKWVYSEKGETNTIDGKDVTAWTVTAIRQTDYKTIVHVADSKGDAYKAVYADIRATNETAMEHVR